MGYTFSAKETLEKLEIWTKEKMQAIGGVRALIGISGGKDSSVTAALLTKVLGSDNVYGILMPDGEQKDISYSEEISEFLGIHRECIDISPMTSAFIQKLEISAMLEEVHPSTLINLPARVRMTLLYAFSQSIPQSRVINTSNLSEDWVGYATVYGDAAGAFAPLAMLTTEEVIEIGRELGVPEKFLVKPPADGLTGRTDEDVLGYTYSELNAYIREGKEPDELIKSKIDTAHRLSRFKFETIPMFDPQLPIRAPQVGSVYPTE